MDAPKSDHFPFDTLPRAVVFDWDNTLIDNWAGIAGAMNDVRAAFGQSPWTDDEAKKNCARALRESFPEWYGDAWEKARDIFYASVESKHLSTLTVLDDAESLLATLFDAGIPLFVVSTKRGDLLRAEANHLGWGRYFYAVLGANDAPKDKPARDPVDMALATAGLAADDPTIWYVGDRPVDVACARASGCRAVVIHDCDVALQLGVDLAFSSCSAMRDALILRMPNGGAGPVEKNNNIQDRDHKDRSL